jgi:hypothetical protein
MSDAVVSLSQIELRSLGGNAMKRNLVLWMATVALGATLFLVVEGAAQSEGVTAHMLVTVEARKGSDVPTINKEDVMVFEGRDRDKVTDWVAAKGDNAAMELFILLDDGSNFTLGSQIDDLKKFIDAQPGTTKVGVAYMQNGMAKVEQDLTSDHQRAAKALRLPLGMPGVNASPYFSVSDLVKKWPASNARHEIVMASDGIDHFYGTGDLQDPYLSAAIEDSQRAGVLIYAIYFPGAGHFGHDYWANYWGQLYLSKLTDETGGESYNIGFTGPPVAFAPFLNDAAGRWEHQYTVSFVPKPQKKAGMQNVKLRTEVPNAELVGASRVYVPASR